jgi:hypothetical protein
MMLFTMHAVTNTTILLSSSTGKKYHRKAQICWSIHGMSAVAPAGGCVVFVRCITTRAMAVASGGEPLERGVGVALEVEIKDRGYYDAGEAGKEVAED